MSLWFVLALMTAAATFAVLWPLGRRSAAGAGAGADIAVYRDQLAELERHGRAGLIGSAEAEAARVEVGRRRLAADAAETRRAQREGNTGKGPVLRRRIVAVGVILLLPLGAVALYGRLGSPNMPDAPLAERASTPLEARSVETLVKQVESHLETNPEDGRGWEIVAPVYLRLGRYEDAVKARRNALRLKGATAGREADLGEALVYAAGGVVTQEAKDAFERALALDAKEVKARYFVGLAAEQDGDRDKAATLWRALLADATPDAPWADLVRRALARVGGPPAAGGPSPEEVAAAEEMPPEARAAMVRGMVDRLATRLAGDGSDIDGWLRLVRAYMVLGEPEKAKAAAADARRALVGDADKLRRVDALMKALGLET
jgi:cytochrome c-type biogenesis protein CcmH